MLKQIDKTLSYNYEFYLCRRDTREPIATLKHGYNICNVSYKAEYRNIDELSLEIPFFVRDKKMRMVTNPIWNSIKADLIIEMIVSIGDEELFTQYFIVNSPKKVGNGDSKKKIVHCYSYEQTLNNIKIRMFQGTRQLYLSSSETVETGQGILNLLEEKSFGDWKIGYISPNAMNETISGQNHRKYRTFAVSDKSWLDFIRTELEPSFECVFEFTYDKIQNCNLINIYHVDEYGQDQGLYISEKNYIDKLEEDLNIDELVTRLTILGKDNLTINSVNLGRGYIEDFSYYRNSDYMTQDLLNAFNTYDNLIAQKTPIFQSYLNQIKDLTSQLNTKVNVDMSALESQMNQLKDDKDIAISQGLDQSEINAQITSKQSEINSKQSEIDSINNQITTVTNNINSLNNEVKLENNFIQEQLKVINRYLREAVWNNENYYEVTSLLEAGKKAQKKMNEPLLNLSVDLPSLLDIVECQYDWKKLKIGDIVYCEYTLWEDFFQTRIVGYTHDITNKTLKIDLSNRDFKYDNQRYISELSKEVGNTSATVGTYKDIWNTAKDNGDWINQLIQDGIDATNYAINSVHNGQEISIDERGIKLASQNDSGIVRMLNNIIALSSDGQNFETAITPHGILTKKLLGQILLTTQLYIANESNNVSITKDGFVLKDNNYKTLISPQGICSSDNVSFLDSCDSSNPLIMDIYIDDNVNLIDKVLLKLSVLDYRAYSKSAANGGGVSTTSASGGGTTVTSSSGGEHSHQFASFTGTTGALTERQYMTKATSDFGGDDRTIAIKSSEIGDLYTFNVSTTHSHTISIGSHSHQFSLPSHAHDLVYGIYSKSKVLGNMNIIVDGVTRTTVSNEKNIIDLTSFIATKGWHQLQITSPDLNRISASLYIKSYIGA